MRLKGGQYIRIARTRMGLTQQEVFEEYGVAESTLKRWESGRTEPAFSDVIDIFDSVFCQDFFTVRERLEVAFNEHQNS